MTGRISKLVRKGYVTRTEDEKDRRHQVVEMTDAGYDIWLAYLQRSSAYERELLEPLSVAELRQLNALMRRVMLAEDSR